MNYQSKLTTIASCPGCPHPADPAKHDPMLFIASHEYAPNHTIGLVNKMQGSHISLNLHLQFEKKDIKKRYETLNKLNPNYYF